MKNMEKIEAILKEEIKDRQGGCPRDACYYYREGRKELAEEILEMLTPEEKNKKTT